MSMLKRSSVFLIASLLSSSLFAGTYNLSIGEKKVNFSGSEVTATAINNQIPGPTLRFKEGEVVTLNVTNNLKEDTSLHWHGLIVPYKMDGVPGITFDGIKPGTTFTYTFPIKQSGTYWYHSHSGLQEQSGVYGSIVITPKDKDPVSYDRDYVIVLSDWTDENPDDVLKHLKSESDYYKKPKRTLAGLVKTLWNANSWTQRGDILSERGAWAKMRMDPTDITDITGYQYLMNGKTASSNWTGIFKKGEKIRLRFINAAAGSYFNVSIPGLKMVVVQADGQNIQPVSVDRFNIAIAETYDVIVTPKEDIPYTIFAQSQDRSGYARGTLATAPGQQSAIPPLLPRRVLTLSGIMAGMDSKSTGGMDMMGKKPSPMSTMNVSAKRGKAKGNKGQILLTYDNLRSLNKTSKNARADRTIVMRLTGNMERYYWSFNDVKFSMAKPIKMKYGERVRIKFVNETMMDHPIHLHGMWQELQNGSGDYAPRKHTINVPPMGTVVVEVPVDNAGSWAFHCHILYHASTGMFRQVDVE